MLLVTVTQFTSTLSLSASAECFNAVKVRRVFSILLSGLPQLIFVSLK